MFANLIIDSSVQGYRFNERESAAAFAVLEKFAGLAGALILAAKSLPLGLGGMRRPVSA
jgi:hypothetical protein